MEPLTRLKEAAVSVANGNYEIKVPSEGKTELAQVGKSFNLMTGKVREQIEKHFFRKPGTETAAWKFGP